MADSVVLPHGLDVALDALRGSDKRLNDAIERVLRGGGAAPVWIALSEALYWVAVLDDQLRRRRSGYSTRRATEDDGRAAGGLVYARNRHAHELASTGEAVFTLGGVTVRTYPPGETPPPPGRGTLFSMQLSWVDHDALPPPGMPEKNGRDQLYRDRVERRPLSQPITDAIRWFQSWISEH